LLLVVSASLLASIAVVSADSPLLKSNNYVDNKFYQHHQSNRNTFARTSTTRNLLQIRGGGPSKKFKKKKSVAESAEGKASIVSSVFNLVNNVAGAGILTLSSGMAPGTGWIPAMAICAVLGGISGHCFSIVGEACEMTGEPDFKGLWKRTIGEKSAYIVDAIIAIMCVACAIIYSGILGDVFTPLLAQIGFPSQYNGRTSNSTYYAIWIYCVQTCMPFLSHYNPFSIFSVIVITLSLLFPLSLIKDLSALAFTSILGFAAIIYTVLFIIIRYFDGSYKLPNGKFIQDGLIAAMPAFEKTSLWNFDFTSLVLASNLGLACKFFGNNKRVNIRCHKSTLIYH
jgi:sodium-coupled neutral amino acid transporter 11